MSRRIMLAVVCGLFLPGILLAEPRKLLLIDFDNEADQKAHTQGEFMTISTEHATVGKHSLKIKTPGNYMGLYIKDPVKLKKLADYRTFAFDVYNPLPFPISYYLRVEDAKKGRYQNDYNFIPPGQSTIRLSLQAMPYQWQNVGSYVVDSTALAEIVFFLGRDTGTWDPPVEFYISNVRAEHSGVELPKVEGLKAFNFGRARETGSFFGCTAVTDKTPAYSDKTEFGWEKGPWPYITSGNNPDLLGNAVANFKFAVNVKPGQYIVQTCIDPVSQWGWTCQFTTRSLKLCDKEVLNETMDCKSFLKDRFCMFEDDEDTPTTSLWNDRVHRISPVREFEATVGDDGKLTVDYKVVGAGGMSFMVLYPKDKAKEGAEYMKAMDSIRKEAFDSRMNLGYPVADGAAPEATAEEKARGFIAFARSADANLDCASVPAAQERGAALAVTAAQGERASIQLGLYPINGVKDVSIVAGDLKGPGNATIPAAAVDIKKVRHFFKRFGNGSCMQLRPMMVQNFKALELTPGFTQPLWVAVKVADKTPAGQYTGNLKIKFGDKSLDVPMNVTVSPFALDAADDVSISGMCASGAGFWRAAYTDAEEPWWAAADAMMAIQAEHGFNATTSGPGMKLKGIKDGKADIDFADADRWTEMARKHGLTKLGDSYIGFDLNLGAGVDSSPAGNEAAMKAYGVGFPDVLKAAYAAVEQHAKEKNWPPRAYYRLDEPNGPAVETAKKLVELYVKNAPNTKFSGYYAPAAPGSPRDCFYTLLKLSILSTVTEPVLKTIHEAGNQSWIYINPSYCNFQNLRHLYGRWAFQAHAKGLDGLTGGFYFCNTVPYYDMSDLEGAWGVIYPSSKDGVNGTVWLEQIGMGINDYRYLKTVKSKLDAAKKKGANAAAVTDAESFLAEMDKACSLDLDTWRMSSKDLAKPADFVSLRERATKLIQELSK